MTKRTKLLRDDVYEEIGAAYQCVLIELLDGVLQEHGVGDATERAAICGEFLSAMGDFHDQTWFRSEPDGPPLHPLLCFSTEFLNVDTPGDALGDVYLPSGSFSFQEYAPGGVDAYYSGDPAGRVETGPVGGGDETDGEDES